MTLKRIGILSYARISGFIGVLIGLVFSAIAFLILLLQLVVAGGDGTMDQGAGFGMAFGIGVVILLVPVVYGIAGFLFGLLSGAFFNLAARLTGGLEIDIS